ncbi:MAG: type 4a pilus biogenesis protein PilO [Burkholderiaceae bacterium]|nr:type 4a pilus biogenesis protein PilO [Burkholderiaceae bacterium]
MATQTKTPSVDLAAAFEQVAAQFRGLDFKQPGQWPMLPKVASWLLLGVLVVVLLWLLLLSDKKDELEAERNKEPGLRQDYRGKLAQAVNLPELRKQKQQVEEYVTQLEKQLPGKAEMDALLTDINQAGIGRGLQFELFRPGAVAVRDYYAELPITIRVSGRYHDIGAFAADVANLSRIVTLHDLSIAGVQREGGGNLSMDAVARTYRYLDSSEVAAQKKPAAGAKK